MSLNELPVFQLIKALNQVIKDNKSRRKQSDQRRIGSKAATHSLVTQELLPGTNYLPDVEGIKQTGVPVFRLLGNGVWLIRGYAG